MKVFSRRDFFRWAGAGALSAVGGGAYAQYCTEDIQLERRELRLPKWDADGFRVALISDIHANHGLAVARAQEAVRMALAEQPDLIAYTGDFVEFSGEQAAINIELSFEALRDAKCPCVAVLGNHDYWVREPAKVIASVRERTSLQLLRNEPLDVDGVTVFGVDDGIAGRQKPDLIADHGHSKSLLVLYHEPDLVREVPTNASLQLSGHSHGGQICMPGGKPLHLPWGARDFVAGYYPDAQVPLYVSRGVGTTGTAFRFFCPPEVTLLTLRSA